ncbi:MAG: twitch domain-containing radical SAM protein [Bryobacteraceae bacterium]
MSDSNCLCLAAWLHRFTNEQGLHQLCCVGVGETNTLRDADGEPLHIRQLLSDAEVLNSPDLKAIRAGMLRGEWPDACRRCREVEESGGVSARHGYEHRFGRWKPELLAQTSPDGTLSRPVVRSADIRLGNLCNLTCRMCGPGASRPWVEHYNAVQPPGHRLPVEILATMRDDNWVKSQPVRALLEQCLPTVEALIFAGGEPMMRPEMVEALRQCIESGRAGEIQLTYNTNGTLLPEKVTSLWPQFAGVTLIVSIDGFGPLNEYIRRPSKWRDIDRNLHLIEQNFKRWKLRSVVVNTTVQAYNVLEVGPVLNYLSNHFRQISPIPQLSPLFEPSYLSIQMLPAKIKAAARAHLVAVREQARSLGRPDCRFLIDTFETTLTHLDAAAGSSREFMDFLYFSEKSDRQFGDSWRSACKELSALLPHPRAFQPAAG